MKLTIITINYNNKEGLQRTIDSVVCQSYRDFEWIIIDGGSTDGSKELIEQYQQFFSYWCSEPDKGVYNAMNKGILKAKGEYLLFLNSGDALYDKDVLQKVEEVHSNADIISGQVVRMDNNELFRQYRRNIFMQLFIDTINHQGTFIKKSLFNNILYDENLKIVSDWKFWIDAIIRRNASIDIMDIIVAKQDVAGISSDLNIKGVAIQKEEREKVLNELFPPLLRKVLDDYQILCESPYTIYSNSLKRSRLVYALGWRILRILSFCVR